MLTIYGQFRPARTVQYYPYDEALVFSVPLQPVDPGAEFTILDLDGLEARARQAGFVHLPLGPGGTRLRVYRVDQEGTGESPLLVQFRDSTNAHGSYPAGRFVELIPGAPGQYRLDLNRARNPFCAYAAAFPCPVPWPGNFIPAPVKAGERYEGGGLEPKEDGPS